MAKTITQLPDATVVNGSDELIIQQSGVTKRATKTEVLAGIVNANIDANAAIAGTKIASDSITNTQIKSDAAIAGTKISPNFGSQNVVTTGTLSTGLATHASESSSIAINLLGRTSDNTAGIVFDNSTSNAGSQVNYINSVPNSRLAFGTNDTERLRIDSSGNVGIGTSSMSSDTRMHVATSNISALGTQANVMVTTTNAQGAGVGGTIGLGGSVTTSSPTTNMRLFGAIRGAKQTAGDGDTDGYLSFLTMGAFSTAPTERMRIDASGNVGIGTGSPTKRLEVNAAGSDAAIRIKETASHGVSYDITAGLGNNLTFTNDALTDLAYVFLKGNVGIGIAPSSKLHVVGDLTVGSATTATAATAGANGDVPAQVEGYLVVSINGTSRKIPYYAT